MATLRIARTIPFILTLSPVGPYFVQNYEITSSQSTIDWRIFKGQSYCHFDYALWFCSVAFIRIVTKCHALWARCAYLSFVNSNVVYISNLICIYILLINEIEMGFRSQFIKKKPLINLFITKYVLMSYTNIAENHIYLYIFLPPFNFYF